MHFVVLGKMKVKPTKEIIGTINKAIKDMEKEGIKFKDMNWTLGRYDFVHVFEAPSENVVMKAMIKVSDFVSTETLIAVPREEALKAI